MKTHTLLSGSSLTPEIYIYIYIYHTAGSRMSSDFVSRYCYCIMAVLVEGFSEVFAVSVALAPINKISANAL